MRYTEEDKITMKKGDVGYLVVDGVIKELTYTGHWVCDDGGEIIFQYLHEGKYPEGSYKQLIPSKDDCRAQAIARLG
jgi:hypothetical protein